MILTAEPRTNVNPLWWRIPVWAALTVFSVTQTHGLILRILTGILMGVGSMTFQLASSTHRAHRQVAVLVASVLGLAACFTTREGLAEVLVVVAATRAPRAFDAVALRAYTVVVALGLAATVAVITQSVTGALAGLGIPLLVQRALEQEVLTRERDRAQALLAEVQAGREAETEAAALQERGRIAREMHDVLAHSLAGLSVQLQAVRAVAARAKVGPEVLDPLDKAAELAKAGVAEAREAVSTLRDPVGLGMADLATLVERHPGYATLATTGSPVTVEPASGHAVYRAVQEALTNSARYAPGSTVAVLVAWSPDTLEVTVTDDGPPPGRSAVAGQGSGLGLVGMAERVTEAGGSVTSGPRAGTGWQTRLLFPVPRMETT